MRLTPFASFSTNLQKTLKEDTSGVQDSARFLSFAAMSSASKPYLAQANIDK